jgi:ADP-ribosylglycohydrolase
MELKERYRGALLGLATGDAMGVPLEYAQPGSFEPISDMIGGGPFNLNPGDWTGDTSMALCLAESLIEVQGFDVNDQIQRYVRWGRESHLSSKGYCFDISGVVAAALHRFEKTGNPYAGATTPNTAGNSSLMRVAPVPLAYARQPAEAITKAGDSSRTTHATQQAVDACRYLGALIVGAVNGVDKQTLLAPGYCPIPGYWDSDPLHPEVDDIAAGSFTYRNPPDIRAKGHVVSMLEAALWAFYHSTTFQHGCLLAVNLGEDADTVGAVYGQLAGAFYGEQAIPQEWRDKLALRETIEEFAEGLLALAERLESQET